MADYRKSPYEETFQNRYRRDRQYEDDQEEPRTPKKKSYLKNRGIKIFKETLKIILKAEADRKRPVITDKHRHMGLNSMCHGVFAPDEVILGRVDGQTDTTTLIISLLCSR